MYNNIPKLQTGAYIPGYSSSRFGSKLQRDLSGTQSDLRSLGRNILRKKTSSNIFGNLGKILGKKGMSMLTKGLAGSNPFLALVLNAAGGAGGKFIGSKLGYGKKASIDKNSELLGSQFKDLSEYQSGIGKEAAGEAIAGFGTDVAKGFKSEYGQKIMDSLRAKKVDPVEQLGGSLGVFNNDEVRIADKDLGRVSASSVEDLQSNNFEKGMFPSFEQSTNRENSNPFSMDYRTTTKSPDELMGALSNANPTEVNFGTEPMDVSVEGVESVNVPKLPKGGLLGRLQGAYSRGRDYKNELEELGLARMHGGVGLDKYLGYGKRFAQDVTNQGMLDNAKLLMGNPIDPYAFLDDVEETPNVQNALLGLTNTVSQYNTPGMAHGGYVPEQGFGGLIQHRKGY